MTTATIADQDARDRIAADLDATLFVEAGAGSGKTKALVDRIVALVADGTAIDQIAAITFTEKAAAELRERVRARLLGEIAEAGTESVFAAALDRLDHAAISTLHAFAQRLLFEHPIEAGLPPGVEVLDELGSQLAFDDRWERQLPRMLADPDLVETLLVADALGIGPAHLRSLAIAFEDNWDLVARRLDPAPPAPAVDVEPLCRSLRTLAGEAVHCSDPEDQLALRLRSLAHYADALHLAGSADDPVDGLTVLAELLRSPEPRFATTGGEPFRNLGRLTNWSGDREYTNRLKAQLFELGVQRDALCASLTEAVIHRLAAAVGTFVLDGVDERRTSGRLRFHDLLVLAREVLRHPHHGGEVRASVRDRYRRLLIDEFQDTDPIQVDLAVLIAANGPVDGRDWNTIDTEAGRLFFVGDPKQSIYRFRRADIATYLRCQDRFGAGGASVALTSNFRSAGPVIDWVNDVFATLITHEPDSQPRYMALDPTQPAPTIGPGVRVFGGVHHDEPNADELRRREAAGVVDAIRAALDEGWTVRDRSGPDGPTERRCRLGDITILLPARTALPALERALETAGIAYRAETASLVYSSAEVRDLMMIARAIDDPTDELAVVAALRTPAFGCGDDDLARHRLVRRSAWDYRRVDISDDDDPVAAGLAWLGARHEERTWTTPAGMLDRIARERRLYEFGVLDRRHREVWRRLRFVIDQARAWSDGTGGDLRAYLRWARLQASESARVAETVLPETDSDAVRIMTVHASKGLEFPVTIVSGLTTRAQGARRGVQVTFPPDGGIGYRFGAAATTAAFERFAPIDEEMSAHERLRLLYVACTRASDHLVVSVHRTPAGPRGSLASALAGALGPEHEPGSDENERRRRNDAPVPGSTADGAGGATEAGDSSQDGGPPDDRDAAESSTGRQAQRTAWLAERERVLAAARRSRTVSATALAAAAAGAAPAPIGPGAARIGPSSGLAKAPRNLDLPSWQKGRYGTAVGRAVHGVLQTCDLATGHDIDASAAAQAAAEGILGREQTVARLARSALMSPTVAAAVGRPHWRELFVAAPVGDRLLEGYVDLLWESDDGLVVVDYKTDGVEDESGLDAKVAHYGVQAGAYAIAVEAATGMRVARAVLVFLSESAPLDVVVPDLDAARHVAASTAAAIDMGTNDPDD